MSNRPAQGASALIAEGTISHRSARSEWNPPTVVSQQSDGGRNFDQSSLAASQGPPQGYERRSLDPALCWRRRPGLLASSREVIPAISNILA